MGLTYMILCHLDETTPLILQGSNKLGSFQELRSDIQEAHKRRCPYQQIHVCDWVPPTECEGIPALKEMPQAGNDHEWCEIRTEADLRHAVDENWILIIDDVDADELKQPKRPREDASSDVEMERPPKRSPPGECELVSIRQGATTFWVSAFPNRDQAPLTGEIQHIKTLKIVLSKPNCVLFDYTVALTKLHMLFTTSIASPMLAFLHSTDQPQVSLFADVMRYLNDRNEHHMYNTVVKHLVSGADSQLPHSDCLVIRFDFSSFPRVLQSKDTVVQYFKQVYKNAMCAVLRHHTDVLGNCHSAFAETINHEPGNRTLGELIEETMTILHSSSSIPLVCLCLNYDTLPNAVWTSRFLHQKPTGDVLEADIAMLFHNQFLLPFHRWIKCGQIRQFVLFGAHSAAYETLVSRGSGFKYCNLNEEKDFEGLFMLDPERFYGVLRYLTERRASSTGEAAVAKIKKVANPHLGVYRSPLVTLSGGAPGTYFNLRWCFEFLRLLSLNKERTIDEIWDLFVSERAYRPLYLDEVTRQLIFDALSRISSKDRGQWSDMLEGTLLASDLVAFPVRQQDLSDSFRFHYQDLPPPAPLLTLPSGTVDHTAIPPQPRQELRMFPLLRYMFECGLLRLGHSVRSLLNTNKQQDKFFVLSFPNSIVQKQMKELTTKLLHQPAFPIPFIMDDKDIISGFERVYQTSKDVRPWKEFAFESEANFQDKVIFALSITDSIPGLPRHLPEMKLVGGDGSKRIDISNARWSIELKMANARAIIGGTYGKALNTPELALQGYNWWKNVLPLVKKPPPEYFDDRPARYALPRHTRQQSDFLDWNGGNPPVPKWEDLWLQFLDEKTDRWCYEPLNDRFIHGIGQAHQYQIFHAYGHVAASSRHPSISEGVTDENITFVPDSEGEPVSASVWMCVASCFIVWYRLRDIMGTHRLKIIV